MVRRIAVLVYVGPSARDETDGGRRKPLFLLLLLLMSALGTEVLILVLLFLLLPLLPLPLPLLLLLSQRSPRAFA